MQAHRDNDTEIEEENEDFYEMMPMTADHYVFSDNVAPERSNEDIQSQARRTAIITLILVGITAIALGLLLAKGLVMLRDNTGAATTSSGSLEP